MESTDKEFEMNSNQSEPKEIPNPIKKKKETNKPRRDLFGRKR